MLVFVSALVKNSVYGCVCKKKVDLVNFKSTFLIEFGLLRFLPVTG